MDFSLTALWIRPASALPSSSRRNYNAFLNFKYERTKTPKENYLPDRQRREGLRGLVEAELLRKQRLYVSFDLPNPLSGKNSQRPIYLALDPIEPRDSSPVASCTLAYVRGTPHLPWQRCIIPASGYSESITRGQMQFRASYNTG